jgi:hypothetical protein
MRLQSRVDAVGAVRGMTLVGRELSLVHRDGPAIVTKAQIDVRRHVSRCPASGTSVSRRSALAAARSGTGEFSKRWTCR